MSLGSRGGRIAREPAGQKAVYRPWMGLFLTVVTCTAALAWLQFAFDGFWDTDGYFHARAAQQLWEGGVRKDFAPTVFSTWHDRYSDKDFLFHLLLIPFCHDASHLLFGGKLAVVFFDGLLLAAMACTLGELKVRFGPLWLLLFLSTSTWLVQHLCALRPHLLALSLLSFEVLLLVKGRWKSLAAVSAVHTLAHTSFVLLPALPLAQVIAHRIHGEPFSRRPLAGVLVGITVATLLHPYFPNNATVLFDQVVGVASNVWTSRPAIPHYLFGAELFGMPFSTFRDSFPGWLPAAVGLLLALFFRRNGVQPSSTTTTIALLAGGYLVLSLLSQRFFSFFAVLSALLAGAIWTQLWASRVWQELWRRQTPLRWLVPAALAGCLVVGQLRANPIAVHDFMSKYISGQQYRPAIEFLDRVARPRDIVYHNSWSEFSWLYYFRPNGRYIQALDPVFLYGFDRELFQKMLAVFDGRAQNVYEILAQDFCARWIFLLRRGDNGLRKLVTLEPRFRRVYVDSDIEVYDVLGSESACRNPRALDTAPP